MPPHGDSAMDYQSKVLITNNIAEVYNGASPVPVQNQSRRYRPVATRSWALAAFLLALAGCIAYFEIVRFSQRSLSDYVPPSRPQPDLDRRQVISNDTSATTTSVAPGEPAPSSLLVLDDGPSTSSTSISYDTDFVYSSSPQTTPPAVPTSPDIIDGDPPPSSLLSLTSASSAEPSHTAPHNDDPYPAPTAPRPEDQLLLSQTFTKADYFLAMYLPTFLTVVLQAMWTITFASTKMMEPFYQLSKNGGAEAQHTLLADYLSSGLSLNSLSSLFSGHIVMLCASSVQLLMGLVVTLAGESMTVKPTEYSPVTNVPTDPKWFVNVSALRPLQALMAVVFVLVFVMIILNWRRQSGVSSDPSTIAAMAGLLSHPSLVQDLRNIPATATNKEVKQALTGNRYMLADFQDELGRQQYGVVKIPSSNDTSTTGYGALPPSPTPLTMQKGKPRPWLLILRDVVFLLTILALFGIIVAYKNLHGNELLNVFLNSNSFGPRFILSGVAVIINSGWKRLEREVRVMEPYRRMARRPSPASTTVHASMTASPFTTVVIALRRRWYFVSFIAAVTVSSELLLIAMPGIPFSTAQIEAVYLASSYVSAAILGVMAVAVVLVLVRRRGDPKDMPRQPDSLAAVWLYLCASDMIRTTDPAVAVVGGRSDVAWPLRSSGSDSGEGEKEEMLREQQQQPKMYWFGRAPGADGRSRWTVHEDMHDGKAPGRRVDR